MSPDIKRFIRTATAAAVFSVASGGMPSESVNADNQQSTAVVEQGQMPSFNNSTVIIDLQKKTQDTSASQGLYSTTELREIKLEYKAFLDTVNSLVNREAEPEFFALMEKRLASEPNKYFSYTYGLGYDDKPGGQLYLYYPDLDIQDPETITPSIVVFVEDRALTGWAETPALIDLQFNEFGRLTRTEESVLLSYELKYEAMTEMMDRYLKTTNETRGLPWNLHLDVFGNRSFIDRKQSDVILQQITFAGYATNGGILSP